MKKIYTLVLVLTSVLMAHAETPLISDINFAISKWGSPRLALTDSFNTDTEYATRRYIVYACNGEAEICVMDTMEETKSKGGNVSSYSVKDSTICKLYSAGVPTIRLYVAAYYQASSGDDFTPYLAENNDRTFYGEYTLPEAYCVGGFTMQSDVEEDTVYYYSVYDGKKSMYGRYYMDSARLSVKISAVESVTAQWQKREVQDVKDETTPWSNYGDAFVISADDAQLGKIYSIDVPMNGEGGFRNQYWQIALTIADTTITCTTGDVFPEYPFVMVGPMATSGGSYYSPDINVEAGEQDTVWTHYGNTKSFTGSEAAPCYTIISCNPACEYKVQESGVYTITQPGKMVTLTSSEKGNIRLTFLDSDKSTVLSTIDCQCGKSLTEQSIAAPNEPTKADSTFSAWVLSWKTAWDYTSAELVEEIWTTDTKFFASYEVASGLEDIMATMPVGSKAYNVLGQPVADDYKGIVIINGKKFFVR